MQVTNIDAKQEFPIQPIASMNDVARIFPRSAHEIAERVALAKSKAEQALQKIIALPTAQRTFENTAKAYDDAAKDFSIENSALTFLEHVSIDAGLREASHKAAIELQAFAVDNFNNNVALYQAIKSYVATKASKEQLDAEQKYFLEETMKDFKRNGLDLSETARTKVVALQKEIAQTTLVFSKNIAEGQRSITVTAQELQGVHADFLASLSKNADGLYVVGTDYPTFAHVMQECIIEGTRKKLYLAYMQCAYPENMAVLNQLIAQRNELALLLGFESYAQYDISNNMAKTPERVQQFIDELFSKARIKEQEEFEDLIKHLPASVSLVADKKLKPWDRAYTIAEYKKNYFNVDERVLSEYFPLEKTVRGLIHIYEKFMSITIQDVPAQGLWHEDVRVLKISDKAGTRLRGYLILDLYPRQNKYNHAASFTIVPTVIRDGVYTTAVDVVVANFPKSTPTKPALLLHSDVETFFHEFGHAIHTILGSTQLSYFSGTSVKMDFVEMPSQMLEEWMWDKTILKQLSSHYKTGAHLPDDLLEKKLSLKNLERGYFILRQLLFAQLSLSIYESGAQKNTDQLVRTLSEKFAPHSLFVPEAHFQASFGHLTNYAASYYCYMWSKVFALDMFATIKKSGLENPVIGQRYVQDILAKGGSVDPNILLKNFLGREPNQEAFLHDLGLN